MSIEQKLVDLYIANIDIIGDGFPMWFNARRREVIEEFSLCGLPDKRDERYKLSDMRELFGREWEHSFIPAQSAVVSDQMPVEGYEIEIINGLTTDPELLHVLDNGVIYGSLKAASLDFESIIKAHYNSIAANKTDAVTALNSAIMQDGAFIYVPEGVKLELPFVVDCEYSTSECSLMCFSRLLMVCEPGSSASLLVRHSTVGDSAFLVDHVSECVVAADAEVAVSELSHFNQSSVLVASNYTCQKCGSHVKTVSVALGGELLRLNYSGDLSGYSARNELYALYMGGSKERVDLTVSVNHLVADCSSFELVKGLVSDQAVGAFTGRVYVAPDAQRSSAMQQSRNLQLSDTARIYTRPQLEIYADDVKCSHGATVGQLDSDAIYYMRQRGISEQDARKLQMSGFVNDVVSKCDDQVLAAYIYNLCEKKIDSL